VLYAIDLVAGWPRFSRALPTSQLCFQLRRSRSIYPGTALSAIAKAEGVGGFQSWGQYAMPNLLCAEQLGHKVTLQEIADCLTDCFQEWFSRVVGVLFLLPCRKPLCIERYPMRRFLPAFLFIAISLTLFSQTSVPRNKPEEPDPCSVAGRVVTAAEGSPLKAARALLVPERSRPDTHIYAASSDSDGRFLLKDVAPGRYQFFATRAGFVTQQYQSQGTEGGAVLGLKPGQKISDVLFRMTVAAVISGRVNNEDGEPTIGVQVVALRRPNEEDLEEESPFNSRKQQPVPVASARADDRGQYRIFGLKPGEYYIRASDSFDPDPGGIPMGEDYWAQQSLGSEYAPVYYPGVGQVAQAEMVSVRPGEEVQADFSMQRIKTVEVAGHIMGREGPAKSALVSLEPSEGYEFGFGHQDTTDEKGNFRLKGVPPGSYVIIAYQQTEGEGIYEAQARQKIEINGENIESLTIVLGGGAKFEGRVTVAGAGSVTMDRIRVGLNPIDEEQYLGGHGRVKKDGTFQITSVKDGDYAINVWGLEHDWFVKSARLGPNELLEKGLQVEEGVSGGRLEIIVSAASAQVDGSVTDGNQAIIGAHVRIEPDPETPYNRFRSQSTKTDQTGRFSITGLAPGKYRVLAKSQPSPESGSLKSEPQVLMLGEHDHKTVELTLPKPQAQ
jgi:Carboxypeptidase regulatory-like domain